MEKHLKTGWDSIARLDEERVHSLQSDNFKQHILFGLSQ